MPDPVSRRDAAIGGVVALLGGVVVGTIGTFKHQVGVSAATGEGRPVGLVLSLAMVAVFLVALRLGFPSRWLVVAAAAGVVAAGAVLSLPGASGGSTIYVRGAVGTVWAVAPAVLAVVVIAWPRPRARVAPGAGGILDAHDARRRTTE